MPAALPLAHVLPRGTQVTAAGRLEIGGCDTVELAREFGTPAYIVAEDDLRARAREFIGAVAARHRDFDLVYASKAFPCTAILRVLAEEGLACDVASGGELHLALAAGLAPERILVHGNAKSLAELTAAVEAGVGWVVLDNLADLERLARVCADRGVHQPVLIRVTPDVAGDTHRAISTGQADSKFGFSLAQAREAIKLIADVGVLRLDGLHAHIGSQLFELEPFRAAARALGDLGEHPIVNLGGGLGVAYTAAQHPPAIDDYVDMIVRAVHEVFGADRRLQLEPGRALVANSTVTLYSVEVVKRNVSTWVSVDGGMSDNLRPMLYGAGYEALLADRPLAPATTRCHLAGKHCESGDVIIQDLVLPDPQPGDVVVTPATGAYGYAMANNYNGVPRPPVVLCAGGQARVVVRRETVEELTARDV
jgi:diaminopimelate decarboxylase